MTHYAMVSPLRLCVTKGLPSQIKVCSHHKRLVSRSASVALAESTEVSLAYGSGGAFWSGGWFLYLL